MPTYEFPIFETALERLPPQIYLAALKTTHNREQIAKNAASLAGRVEEAATAARSAAAAELDPAELARLRADLAVVEARAHELRSSIASREHRAATLAKAASTVEQAGANLAPLYAAATHFYAVEDALLARERQLNEEFAAFSEEDRQEAEPLTPSGAPEVFARLSPAQQTARLLRGISCQLQGLQLGYPLQDGMVGASCAEVRALVAERFRRPFEHCPRWSNVFGELQLDTVSTGEGFKATGKVRREPGDLDRAETALENALRALYGLLPSSAQAEEPPRLYRLQHGTFQTDQWGNDGKELRPGKTVWLPASEAARLNDEDERLNRDADCKDSRTKRGVDRFGRGDRVGGTPYVPRFVLAEEGGKGKTAAVTPG